MSPRSARTTLTHLAPPLLRDVGVKTTAACPNCRPPTTTIADEDEDANDNEEGPR